VTRKLKVLLEEGSVNYTENFKVLEGSISVKGVITLLYIDFGNVEGNKYPIIGGGYLSKTKADTLRIDYGDFIGSYGGYNYTKKELVEELSAIIPTEVHQPSSLTSTMLSKHYKLVLISNNDTLYRVIVPYTELKDAWGYVDMVSTQYLITRMLTDTEYRVVDEGTDEVYVGYWDRDEIADYFGVRLGDIPDEPYSDATMHARLTQMPRVGEGVILCLTVDEVKEVDKFDLPNYLRLQEDEGKPTWHSGYTDTHPRYRTPMMVWLESGLGREGAESLLSHQNLFDEYGYPVLDTSDPKRKPYLAELSSTQKAKLLSYLKGKLSFSTDKAESRVITNSIEGVQ